MRLVYSPEASAQGHARHLVLLAPLQAKMPTTFGKVTHDPLRYRSLLAEMQRLRGDVYLRMGSVEPSQLSLDGRHQLPTDQHSWHLLVLGSHQQVMGCMRFRMHVDDRTIHEANVFNSPLATCDRWGAKLKREVEAEVLAARREGIGFGEAGGWALSDEVRCSAEALRLVLSTFSLAQLLGDARTINTCTMRNGSAQILRRLGGQPLGQPGEEFPVYYDPHYKCEMQLLRFDSRTPSPRYRESVDEFRAHLMTSTVICGETARRPLHMVARPAAPLPMPVPMPMYLPEAAHRPAAAIQ